MPKGENFGLQGCVRPEQPGHGVPDQLEEIAIARMAMRRACAYPEKPQRRLRLKRVPGGYAAGQRK
jgi:hypothetical protein